MIDILPYAFKLKTCIKFPVCSRSKRNVSKVNIPHVWPLSLKYEKDVSWKQENTLFLYSSDSNFRDLYLYKRIVQTS